MSKLWSRTSDPLGYLAWYAANSVYTSKALEVPDAFNTAYAAILEAHRQGLTDEGVLLGRANRALNTAYLRLRSFRGQRQHSPGLTRGAVAYWVRDRTPFEDLVTERTAVRQVMNALPDRYRQVLTDLANGIRPRYPADLARARHAAWELWYDQETPQRKVFGNSKKA